MTYKVKSAGVELNSAIRNAVDEKYFIIDELIRMSVSNVEFYKSDRSFVGLKMHASFAKVIEFLEKSTLVTRKIESFAGDYDFDENTPGNGYRSFIFIFDAAVKHSEKICKYITDNRGYLLFRKSVYMKEIDVCAQIFESLFMIFENLIIMHENSDDGNLYSKEYSHDNLITRNARTINQVCFHGRAIGFQYCDSMKPILRFLAVSMASYSESYFSTGFKLLRSTSSLFSSSKYFLDPEYCAQRIVSVSHNAEIDFCKSYWFLAEGKLMHTLPSIVGYKVDVNKVFKIPPEPLQIYSEKFDKMMNVPLPRSHTGVGPVSCRLLSAKRRKGMVGDTSSSLEPSKYLLLHSHGGGWVAQSSKSHELYLREWAVKMDIPILSIDYSLAPEAPFPRAFEDIFYTYCWVLKNVEFLGSTGENIVFAGDSAGGNLNTACVVKCIEMGIRKPKGLFNAYTPFLVNFASTPARFLSLVDPLLPYGFIMRVFKSYGAVNLESNEEFAIKETETNNKNDHDIVKDIRDDDQEKTDLMSPDSSKILESMWQKIKVNAEESEWQTNLGSIRETLTEEPSSPFNFTENEDDEPLEIKISEKNGKAENFTSISVERKHCGNGEPDPTKDCVGLETLSNNKSTNLNSEDAALHVEKKPKPNRAYDEKLGNLIPRAPDDEFVFTVPKNQYISPYWASDETLKQFPPMKVLTTIVDPCIDDSVEFSKKLKNLGVDVHLDILEGLNHGFLNFAQVSKESHDGSMLCMKRIAELLDLKLKEE